MHRSFRITKRIALAALLIWNAPSIFAGTTGKIAGLVKDASNGEGLPGANIIIRAQIVDGREIRIENVRGGASNVNGKYFILNIRPGTYVVECSFIGYQTTVQKPVRVQVDRTTTLDFSLSPEAITAEEVVVTAERPLVVKDLTSASAKVSGEDIKSLPVERFDEVIALQAGITKDIGGGLHIRGGRASEVKYYVDGIAISSPFSNALAVPVENNAIQELEVISGTFNAEYGQAQSGIVNIVTREGSEALHGDLTAYVGDFATDNDDIFQNIDDINPTSQQYFEGNLSGPFLTKRLKFFASGRYTNQENWLYGRRVYLPQDSANFTSPNPAEWHIEQSGDGAFVPMNTSKSLSGQFKLTFNPTSVIKLAYNLIANKSEGKGYSNFYKYNPDSRRTNFTTAFNHLFSLTHTVSSRAFYTLKAAYYVNDLDSYVYEDPLDPRYQAIFGTNRQPQFVFSTGGVDPQQFFQRSETFAVRADFNMQINSTNLIKIGAEYRTHTLDLQSYNIDVDPLVYGDYNPRIPPITSIDHNAYNTNPVEFSAYAQDKIEIDDLIVNAGFRFDHFNPNGQIPIDLRDPANKLFPKDPSEAFTEVKAKTQFSPRFGLAFPITDQGVIHAAYGLFFQIPEFSRLYENPEFEVISGVAQSFIGNADLDAQRTDMYEIGLQQQLSSFLAVDVTGFYRNVRNLLGSSIFQTYRTDILYGRYENEAHGNVRGLTLSTKIRVPDYGVTADINYTYQVAKGIASDPKQAFFDARGRNEATIVLNSLDWDLRHTANAFVNLARKNWGASTIVRYNSGFPFTPTGFVELRNAGRDNGDFFIDLRAYKRFNFGRYGFELFTKVENVLDRIRINQLPQVDPRLTESHQINGYAQVNSLYEFLLNPAIQPTPREVRVGMKVSF